MIESLRDFDRQGLSIYSARVLARMRSGDPVWEEMTRSGGRAHQTPADSWVFAAASRSPASGLIDSLPRSHCAFAAPPNLAITSSQQLRDRRFGRWATWEHLCAASAGAITRCRTAEPYVPVGCGEAEAPWRLSTCCRRNRAAHAPNHLVLTRFRSWSPPAIPPRAPKPPTRDARGYEAAFAENGGALEGVAQLAHVARPMVTRPAACLASARQPSGGAPQRLPNSSSKARSAAECRPAAPVRRHADVETRSL